MELVFQTLNPTITLVCIYLKQIYLKVYTASLFYRQHTHKKDPLEAIRPGFCRINLPYFASDTVIDYILDAIDMVATHGWKLLPQVSTHAMKTGP